MTHVSPSHDRVKDLVKLAKKSLKEELSTAAELSSFSAFLEGFYPISSPDDLMAREPSVLVALAYDVFKASKKRKGKTPIVRVINPRKRQRASETDHTVVQIVNGDMPFLVDSITGALSVSLRYRIHMMHHPIITVARDKDGSRLCGDAAKKVDTSQQINESVMYIEIDAQSDKQVLKELKDTLNQVLSDVNNVVTDFKAMLAKIDETVASLTVNPPPIGDDEVQETIKFLRWLGANHFTFLGFREYRFSGKGKNFTYEAVKGSGLGILRDPDRHVLRDKGQLTAVAPEVEDFLTGDETLLITKANVKATVHRNIHMDYIGVKLFDADGKPVGERRLIGLFTSLSYSRFASDVPLLRNKVQRVIDRSPFSDNSYGSKSLNHILEGFPRDELFQIPEDLLFKFAMGATQLMERPRPKAFIRRDLFGRYVSALVYVPRDTYHSQLRMAIADILCEAFDGEVSVYHAQLSDNALARWHFIIRTKPGAVPDVDFAQINDRIADAAQGWTDRLLRELITRHGEEKGILLNNAYRDRFSNAYREAFTPAQAAYDIVALEDVTDTDRLDVDFYRHLSDGPMHYRLKIYHGSRVVALSDCMPILEDMGFRVLSEHSFELADASNSHIHDFRLERPGGLGADHNALKPLIEDMFRHVWLKDAEEDGFNELVLTAGMHWSHVVILRAYGKYLRQLGIGFTPEYIADCVVKHSLVARQLISVFDARFNPAHKPQDAKKQEETLAAEVLQALEEISSLDEDRILRAYLNVIQSTLRTNFYQEGILKPRADSDSPVDAEKVLAFKIRTRDVDEAPLPRPHAEIWVYSPRVEGVHLRGGPVARGGLRWSDRREDFRTEVLGLVKAQQVKNAVIVPQGAKGGFFAKRLPPPADRDAFWAEGIGSYRAFISSLLSLTDNLDKGTIMAPKDTVRQDGDDPYLVVAADKGTATFSDIANELSEGHGFWLGDAFASGGSYGYDHKKMGITAKGAWVSVQRHMRELGINTQEDTFSVIGVGDMSGDVFGNGMLLSETIQLKAAFNHMHIFLDPNPADTKATFKERKRLFDLPRSTWDDYNKKLISKGGGVFSRAAKSIALSKEVQAFLGVSAKQMAPNELINTILKADADVLWFGGIGTYVRAETETDVQVGDRANDSVRVTDADLRVKVIGEGGNLGMTQKSRIAWAKRGGRLNTDFIDNSAGVDCSDKEVNIKILMADAISKADLTRDERDKRLVEMTEDVSEIVLSNNYLQTQAISIAAMSASADREFHLGLIRALERDWDLNREIEYLPSDEGFAELAATDKGLTRPEISTLMSHAKLSLTEVLVRGTLIDNDIFLPELEWGFPKALRETFASHLANHRLRREIVATVLANEVVNRAGLTFTYEIKEETGLAVEDIVAAYIVVRDWFELEDKWHQINALDYKVAASVQYDMINSISESMKSQVLWLLRNIDQPFDIKALIDKYRPAIIQLFDIEASVLSVPAQHAFTTHKDGLVAAGVPEELARFVAGFEVLKLGLDIISVSETTGMQIADTAAVHFAVGDALGFEWLRARAEAIPHDDHWEMLAIRSTTDDLADQQRHLVRAVCTNHDGTSFDAKLAKWREADQTKLIRAARLVEDLKGSGTLTVAKLSFAARHLRSILR